MELIAAESTDKVYYSRALFYPMAGKPAADNGSGSANAAEAVDIDGKAVENGPID